MRKIILVIAALSIALIHGGVRPAAAQFYAQHNLVSDGFVPAEQPTPGAPWQIRITDALLAQNQLLAAKNADADSYSSSLSAAAALALATGSVDSIPMRDNW